MSIDNAFARGLEFGANLAFRRRQEARDKELFDADMNARRLQLRAADRIDQATDALNTGLRVGIKNTAVDKAQQDDFDEAYAASARGLEMKPVDPAVWNAPLYRPATDRDITALSMNLAAARGDVAGLQQGLQQQRQYEISDAFKEQKEKLKDESFVKNLLKRVNLDGAMPLSAEELKTKKGDSSGYRITVIDKSGNAKSFEPSQTQLEQLLLGAIHIDKNDFANGYAILSGVNKDLADAVLRWNNTLLQSVNVGNQANNFLRDDIRNDERLALERAGLAARINAERRPNIIQLENDKGEAVLFDINKAAANPDGQVQLPTGLRLPRTRAILSPAEEGKFISDQIAAGVPANVAMLRAAIRAGRVTPEMEIEMLSSESPKVREEKLKQWQIVDPRFADQVKLGLAKKAVQASNAGATPSAAATQRVLPPPLVAVPAPAPQPEPIGLAPRRGPVGVGAARLPWENPTGSW